MATTILSALSFAIYEAPTSSLPERTAFRSFYSWVTCDTQSVCQPYASNGVLTCELPFFFFSVLRYQGKQGRCTHWHETGGERVAWSGGNFLERWITRSLSFSCLVQVDTNFLMYFLLFLINRLYGLNDKNGFQF